MRFSLWFGYLAAAGLGWITLSITVAEAQMPYYELRASIGESAKERTWYSAGGVLDADAGIRGARLRHFVLRGSWGEEKLKFVYKCEGDELGISQDWGNDECPTAENQRMGGIRRFSIALTGGDADKYLLTYECWVAQDGYASSNRGVRGSGEWCGIAHSDEDVWVTRIRLLLERKPTRSLDTQPAAANARS
jgi:hypothetical protein